MDYGHPQDEGWSGSVLGIDDVGCLEKDCVVFENRCRFHHDKDVRYFICSMFFNTENVKVGVGIVENHFLCPFLIDGNLNGENI